MPLYLLCPLYPACDSGINLSTQWWRMSLSLKCIGEPEELAGGAIILGCTRGSVSLPVVYKRFMHALGIYCKKKGSLNSYPLYMQFQLFKYIKPSCVRLRKASNILSHCCTVTFTIIKYSSSRLNKRNLWCGCANIRFNWHHFKMNHRGEDVSFCQMTAASTPLFSCLPIASSDLCWEGLWSEERNQGCINWEM